MVALLAAGVCIGVGVTTACSGDEGVASGRGVTGGSAGSSANGGSGGSAAGSTGGSGNSTTGGSGGLSVPDSGPPPGQDTDQDGIPDIDEPPGDSDGDGIPNVDDPINDGDPPAILLKNISITFPNPIGIDYHEPTDTVVMSVNYSTGTPEGFSKVHQDGTYEQFSNVSGLTEEVKIATARSGNQKGFVAGDLFVGNGIDGQIVRMTNDGTSVINPWVDLPGDSNGLMRGSLYVDRTGEWNWDLIVVTTIGQVWRIDSAGTPTPVADLGGTHLEGLVVVPNKPARFGPLAGKVIAGAEGEGLLYAFSQDGTFVTYNVGVNVEDIDIVNPKENFFGVNYGTGQLLGAEAAQWDAMLGDVILTQDAIATGTTGLYRLKWDGANVVAQLIPVHAQQAAAIGQWEHVTFAGASIKEIPPPPS